MNGKVSGQSAPFGIFGAEKGSGQLQINNIKGAVNHKFCLFIQYFVKNMIFICIESFVEECGSLL